jgi:hypothetical protein
MCCHTMGQSIVSCQVTHVLDSACLQMLGDQPTLGVLSFILVDWGGDQQLRCWPTFIVTHPLQSVSHREMLVSNTLSACVRSLVMSWSPLGMRFCLSHGREVTMTSRLCCCFLAVDSNSTRSFDTAVCERDTACHWKCTMTSFMAVQHGFTSPFHHGFPSWMSIDVLKQSLQD